MASDAVSGRGSTVALLILELLRKCKMFEMRGPRQGARGRRSESTRSLLCGSIPDLKGANGAAGLRRARLYGHAYRRKPPGARERKRGGSRERECGKREHTWSHKRSQWTAVASALGLGRGTGDRGRPTRTGRKLGGDAWWPMRWRACPGRLHAPGTPPYPPRGALSLWLRPLASLTGAGASAPSRPQRPCRGEGPQSRPTRHRDRPHRRGPIPGSMRLGGVWARS